MGLSLILLRGGEEIRCILIMCIGMWKFEIVEGDGGKYLGKLDNVWIIVG